ncbi:MAG: hypothetical protein QOG10_7232 [Kribbellaceae bacterium]|nr:hypothetical protein [Kribbellaceae bacterium]
MADAQRKETAEGPPARSGNLSLRRIPGTVALVALFMAGVAVGAGAVAALKGDGAHSPSAQVAPPVSSLAAQSPSAPVTASPSSSDAPSPSVSVVPSPSSSAAPSPSVPVVPSPSNRVDVTGQVNGSTVFTAGSVFDEPCSGGEQVQVSDGAGTTLRVAKTRLVSQHDSREGTIVTRECKTMYRVNVPAADVYHVSLASIKSLKELNAQGTWETTFNGGAGLLKAPPLFYVYGLY